MTNVQATSVTRWRRPVVKVAAIVAGVLLLFAVLIASCVVAIGHGFRNLGAPVKPIPIPAASCPYLRAVQTTADRAGEGWGDVMFTSDRKTWRPFAVQLRPKLATFELALRLAIPAAPN